MGGLHNLRLSETSPGGPITITHNLTHAFSPRYPRYLWAWRSDIRHIPAARLDVATSTSTRPPDTRICGGLTLASIPFEWVSDAALCSREPGEP